MKEWTINESLQISTTIPMDHVTRFQIQWGINAHAKMQFYY